VKRGSVKSGDAQLQVPDFWRRRPARNPPAVRARRGPVDPARRTTRPERGQGRGPRTASYRARWHQRSHARLSGGRDRCAAARWGATKDVQKRAVISTRNDCWCQGDFATGTPKGRASGHFQRSASRSPIRSELVSANGSAFGRNTAGGSSRWSHGHTGRPANGGKCGYPCSKQQSQISILGCSPVTADL
jgi:hypothetical protein